MTTRVRFAPSPTGPLHIGGLRTALFNYLEAKKNGGAFILRIEDTDQNRYVKGSEEYIQKALKWCGINPDEGPKRGGKYGPYRQSERKSIYKSHAQNLIDKGLAYYAFDHPQILTEVRDQAEKNGETFKYGSLNRMNFMNSLSISELETQKALKGDYVIRLKIIPGEKITVFDRIRGNLTVDSDLLDDKILIKSDGMPTYHFANVVDDKLMDITTVVRGEEWLPSLPIHKLIYDAFGWKMPDFMHLPLILKPSGKGKLSKRDGDKEGFPVYPLKWDEKTQGFKELGFLPSSLVNYLALLGWNDGTENEVFTLSELEKKFSISGIQKGGARFDYEKAKWLNHKYLSNIKTSTLLNKNIIKCELDGWPNEKHEEIIELVKERLYTLNDFKKEVSFLKDPKRFDERAVEKLKIKNPLPILKKIHSLVENNDDGFNIKTPLFEWAKSGNIPLGFVMQSLRLCLFGDLTGPDLFDVCSLLGKDVILKRVENFINHIK